MNWDTGEAKFVQTIKSGESDFGAMGLRGNDQLVLFYQSNFYGLSFIKLMNITTGQFMQEYKLGYEQNCNSRCAGGYDKLGDLFYRACDGCMSRINFATGVIEKSSTPSLLG